MRRLLLIPTQTLLFLMIFFIGCISVYGQEPCESECCIEGPQHTFEGESGLLPPYFSQPSGWEARLGSPRYVEDGCDSPLTSVQLDGATMTPDGDRASLRNPPGPDEIIFQEGVSYCIQMCIKSIGDLTGPLDLFADAVLIGSTVSASPSWQTVEVNWTATSSFTEFSVANNNPATLASATILFDDVCISEVDPNSGNTCQADFSFTDEGCGQYCFINEMCGEVDFFSWNFIGPGLPVGGQGSSEENPCFFFPQSGSYTVQLIVNCLDGTQDTETKMIDVMLVDPPVIACPEDDFILSPDPEPCTVDYIFPNILVTNFNTLTCTIDGNPVNAGDLVVLSDGVHIVRCIASNDCFSTECEYEIIVDCSEDCEGPCYDYNEEGSASNWIRYNDGGARFPSRDPVNLATRAPGDTYLDGVDISGSTWLYNNVDFAGDWTDYEECCFCFDYRYIDDGGTNTTARPCAIIYQGPEDAPVLSAHYISNNPLTDTDPWETFCAPFSTCATGLLPSNADGYWVMRVGSGCADWNTLISNVDGVRFPLDYNRNPRERHGYDNVCWKSCPANPCDSFMVMVDTLNRQIDCVDPSLITGNPCINVYDPVCGCDGNTYSNSCFAREAGVSIISSGECDGTNTPEVEGCCYEIDIVLKSVQVSAIGLKTLSNNVRFNSAMINDPAFTFTTSPSGREIIINPTSGPTFGPGVFSDLIKFCLSVDSSYTNPTQFIEISYYDRNGDELEVECRKSIEVGCTPPPSGDPCLLTEAAEPECQDGYYELDFSVSNVSTAPPFTANQIVLTSCDPGILLRPDGTSFTPQPALGIPLVPGLAPGDPARPLNVEIIPGFPITADTVFCFETTIWNDTMCCTTPDKVCVTLKPCCNPCDSSFVAQVPYNSGSTNATISIKPGSTMDDGNLDGCMVGSLWNNSTQINVGAAWGGFSDGCISDGYLNFPLDDVCDGAVITKAELKLYGDPFSLGHVNTTSLTSGCVDIKRVTSAWTESPGPTTAPTTTSVNQVTLGLPTSPFQDFTVDVTGLVNDMLANPATSFGFALDASCPLDLLYVFASGENINPALWPELIITYDETQCPPVDTGCCHALDVEVGCAEDYFTKLDLEVITPGVILGSHSTGSATPSDWTNPVSTSQNIIWEHTSGTIPQGNYSSLINFCLDDIDPGETPQELTLKWYTLDMNGMDSVACIDTLRYTCEPPVSDSCIALLDAFPKNNLCDTCFAEPFCNEWLLDELIDLNSNHCTGPSATATIESGTYLGETVYIISTDLGWPHTFVERIYNCQGLELQNCHDYIGGFSCDPDAGIDATTDITAKTLLWSCGDPIPSTPSSCTVSYIPNSIDFCLSLKNVTNPARTATQLLINSIDPSVTIFPSPFTFSPPLNSGAIATVDLNVSGNINPGDTVKFNMRLRDGVSDDNWCCFENDTVCLIIPPCPPDPDCCDVTEEEFCEIVDQISVPVIDTMNCEICWDLNALDSCDVLHYQIDNRPWRSATSGQICETWSDNENHDLCLRLERWPDRIGLEEPCLVKDTCLTYIIPCDPCDDDLECSDLSVSASRNGGMLDDCCYDIQLVNNYCDEYFKGIKVSLASPASISSIITNPGWVINQLDNYNAEIYPLLGGLLPLGQLDPFTMCNQSGVDYPITVSWLHQLPTDSCIAECPTVIDLESCDNDFSCFEYVRDSIDCPTSTYCVKIRNTTSPAFDLYSVHLFNLSGGVSFSPSGRVAIPGAPLASGQESDWICVNYSGVVAGDRPCYQISAHNTPVGTPPTQCCTDTTNICFDVPDCPADVCSLCPDGSEGGPNLIQNGDFSNDYNGGWYSTYNRVNTGLLFANDYSVRNSTNLANGQWQAVDHTSGSSTGKFLVIDGPSPGIAYGVPVNVQPNTNYVFCMWVNNLVRTSTRSNPIIQVNIGGTVVEAGYSLPQLPDTWQLITATYNSGSTSGTINIQVVDTDNNQFNDWAIDDVSFRECAGCPPVSDCCLDFNGYTAIDTFGLISPTIANGLGEDYIDVDQDGDYDYLFWRPTTGSSTGDIYYFENQGTATNPNFNSATAISLFTQELGPYGYDYNNDGNEDIFTIEESTREVIYHENLFPAPGFSRIPLGIILPTSGATSIAIGDISNDGIADLLVHETSLGNLEIVYYEGNCSAPSTPCFTLVANSYASPLINIASAQVTSFNQIELQDGDCDGDLDIFMADGNFSTPSPDGQVWYLENYGTVVGAGNAPDVERTAQTDDPFGLTGWMPSFEETTLRFVDIDDDGKVEAFINTGLNGDVYFYENCQNAVVNTSCCCRDSTAFCDLVDLGFTITINDNCTVEVDAPQFDTCHWFGTVGPDWGDGSGTLPALTPAVGAGPWTYSYDSSGTYSICITVFEGIDEDNFCWSKQMCTEVMVECEPDDCCDDFDEFCDLVDLGFQITQNDDCIITIDAPQFTDCHWFGTLGPDWGDGSGTLPAITPAPGAGPWSYAYDSSGTYNICITVYEGTDEDNFCWDKQMCTEITVDCDPKSCCEDFDRFCDLVDLGFQIIQIDSCTVTVNAPQFDSCHWYGSSEPDWGDGIGIIADITPAIGAGPWTYTYDRSGVYDICIDVYEGTDEDNFCWDKQMCTRVEVECPCGPVDCDLLDIYIDDDVLADSCCFIGTIENEYCDTGLKGVLVETDAGSTISQITALNGWYINQISPQEVELYPTTSIPIGELEIFRICNENFSGPFTLTMSWLIDDGNGGCEEICPVEEELDCGTDDNPNRCIDVISDRIDCELNQYCFTIENTTSPAFDIKSIVLHDVTPAGSLSPTVISLLPSLASGQQREVCVNYSGVIPGDDICYTITGHDVDLNVDPYPFRCCTDTVVYCVEIPECPSCCTTFDEFCDLVDLGFDFSVDSSVLSVSLNQFDSCYWFDMDMPDWGDGTPTTAGFYSAAGQNTWSHTYDTTGMYTICMDVYAGDDPDNICWQKEICKMLWIVCDHPSGQDTTDINPCGPSRVNVPNGITPNNDGTNDQLVITGPSECTPIDIVVFNRWGQKVWEQADYDNTWQGQSLNGEQLPDGTYFLRVLFNRVEDQRATFRQFTTYLDIRTN